MAFIYPRPLSKPKIYQRCGWLNTISCGYYSNKKTQFLSRCFNTWYLFLIALFETRKSDYLLNDQCQLPQLAKNAKHLLQQHYANYQASSFIFDNLKRYSIYIKNPASYSIKKRPLCNTSILINQMSDLI